MKLMPLVDLFVLFFLLVLTNILLPRVNARLPEEGMAYPVSSVSNFGTSGSSAQE